MGPSGLRKSLSSSRTERILRLLSPPPEARDCQSATEMESSLVWGLSLLKNPIVVVVVSFARRCDLGGSGNWKVG